jgi:hypothetical protein
MHTRQSRQIPGFFDDGDYLAIDEIVKSLPREGNLIEIGCLMGRSTTAWAEALLAAGKNFNIHAIDSFTSSYRQYASELKGDPALICEVLGPEQSQESLFVQFTQCHPNISYSKMRFDPSFRWESKLHCVFEDSDHSAATLRLALPFWWQKLEPGGVLAGHDYHPDHEEVCLAVDEFARHRHVKVRTYGASSVWSIPKC